MSVEPKQDTPIGRRAMLGKTALAAGAIAVGLSMPRAAQALTRPIKFAEIPGTGDIKVLNYALSLEYLEADLYSQALLRLTSGGTNGLGTTIAGLNISGPIVDYLREFGTVEYEHANLLAGAIGSGAVSAYQYDFGMEHLGERRVLQLVYSAEKTGVAAYLGAIPFLSTKSYLQVAGAIQGVEARHASSLAYLLNFYADQSVEVAPSALEFSGIDTPLNPNEVLDIVSQYIVAPS